MVRVARHALAAASRPAWPAATEIGAGVLFALGLLTPFAAAGMIGVMVVATWAAHRHNGFFIFSEGQGWEYTVSIAVAAWAVATIGPGEASLDHAIGLDWTAWDGWIGAVIAGVLGVGGGDRPARRLLPAGERRRDDHDTTPGPRPTHAAAPTRGASC